MGLSGKFLKTIFLHTKVGTTGREKAPPTSAIRLLPGNGPKQITLAGETKASYSDQPAAIAAAATCDRRPAGRAAS